MGDTKAMTVRLPVWLAEDLETVASVDGIPIAEVVREAVTAHIHRRTSEPDWAAKSGRLLDRLQRLAGA